MLTSNYAQRPAFLPTGLPAPQAQVMQIADQRPRRIHGSATFAALSLHDSAVSSPAIGSGIGVADKRGPATGVDAADFSAEVDATGVPPRGCSG